PSLPARNCHGRRIELLTQFRLTHAHAAAKSNEAGCPSDIRVFLTHNREKLGRFVNLRRTTICPVVRSGYNPEASSRQYRDQGIFFQKRLARSRFKKTLDI